MNKVILVDDQRVVRNGLRMLIESSHQYEVIAEAGNGKQTLDLLANGLEADLILSDISMPEMDGIELLEHLNQSQLAIPVLILSMSENDDDLKKAIQHGAKGYLSKSIDAKELFFAMDRVLGGEKYYDADIAVRLMDKFFAHSIFNSGQPLKLSSRETEVIQLMAKGHNNVEIANLLFLSVRTVEGHRQQLLEKTGSRNTASLIYYAVQNGILL